MWEWIRTSLRVVDRSLLAGAWFFVACTVFQLGWVLWSLLPQGTGTTHMIRTTHEGVERSAIGLTYIGWGGVALAVIQIMLVLFACALTIGPRGRWRAIGHLVLAAWAALYLGNMVWITSLAPVWPLPTISGLMCLFFVCTVYRAVRRRPGRVDPPAGASRAAAPATA